MNNSNRRHAPPKAGAMIEALRGLGYTTASALADIIDNSIAARASRVDINFVWQEEQSRIEIQDNGTGMDAACLDKAMRLGELNPLDEREESDLGRFGMGLKTASFSQCRSLTVATTQNNQFSCLRWDLDVLVESSGDGWFMLEGPSDTGLPLVEPVKNIDHGTLVLWEKLDRIFTDGFNSNDFLDLLDQVERHLAMVFHRYLEDKGQRFEIYINGNRVKPWDPFMTGHPAKSWNSPLASQATQGGTVDVECHVLPHKDRLTDKEFESAGGPDGWTAQQGFYVYRNRRLLLAGSWLGLGRGRSWTKEEAHRLARIRLDIPNTVDSDWKIDIRKATARPPVNMRKWLMRLAEDTRARARKTFASRGRPARTGHGQTVVQAWRADQTSGGVRYRVDDAHPAVRAVLDDAGSLLPQIKAMLRILEETIPVQPIWLDTAENKETPRTGFDGEAPSEVVEVLTVMYQNLTRKKGFSAEAAKSKLLQTEPFHDYPQLVTSLIESA
ncbi:ATP-binding protein [Endozoicomonas sp. SESOKO1]|uniref:ATP-binding protein n=1 Tax=Endozoicomonas sp. SESOKO1 TaxID=2828742 RepID=UPI0021474767|nr:ATP-binding protein [Endozoicomonas sp. SESOKO1]